MGARPLAAASLFGYFTAAPAPAPAPPSAPATPVVPGPATVLWEQLQQEDTKTLLALLAVLVGGIIGIKRIAVRPLKALITQTSLTSEMGIASIKEISRHEISAMRELTKLELEKMKEGTKLELEKMKEGTAIYQATSDKATKLELEKMKEAHLDIGRTLSLVREDHRMLVGLALDHSTRLGKLEGRHSPKSAPPAA